MKYLLEIKDLHVSVNNIEILKGVNLQIKSGEIHAIMGPNGSGKSTFAYALMGHPKYQITKGEIFFYGKKINDFPADKRAKLGMFLSFQYPCEISGVSVANVLRSAVSAVKGKVSFMDFQKSLRENLRLLSMDESFSKRYLNEGFSGGEKKRAEMLQFAMLEPKLAILDETDSGLDIDALKVVAEGINTLKNEVRSFVIITHYQRILNYVTPDVVHVFIGGKIVKSGGKELGNELEVRGYEWLTGPLSSQNSL